MRPARWELVADLIERHTGAAQLHDRARRSAFSGVKRRLVVAMKPLQVNRFVRQSAKGTGPRAIVPH